MKKITFKVTCSLLFGLPEGKEKDALFEDFTIAIRGLWAIPLSLRGTTYNQALRARNRISTLFLDLIRWRRKQLEEGSGRYREDVIGSHDTLTVLSSLHIRHLARDSDVSSKVYEERPTFRALTSQKVGRYAFIPRSQHLPEVFWMAWPTNMDKNIFQDPEKFDPARFEDQSKLLPPFTYILFGAGPRVCLGSEFARVGVLLLIRHLITKYRWTEMFPGEPISRDPMLYPATGLPMKLHPRN
ncbi:hypothetical protein CRG98_038994 [Punica granatum]|uniref:Uncharacterized protein n=1 Tax=Punica granatum TaxID=22663 RepID=A0A2I0I9A0_PUNGR|nr:hypothetical protein CRG98_038994 [Punica granatum]